MHLHDKEVGILFTPQLFSCPGSKSKVQDREAIVSFPQKMVATHQLSRWVGGRPWVSHEGMPRPSSAPTT